MNTFQWFIQLCEVLDKGVVIVFPDPSLHAPTICFLLCWGATSLNHGGERVGEGERGRRMEEGVREEKEEEEEGERR